MRQSKIYIWQDYRDQLMKFIKNHVLGLFGILLLLIDVASIQLRELPELNFMDKLILPVGISLCLAEFLQEWIKISYSNFTLVQTIDKMISKFGTAFLCLLIVVGFYLRISNLGNLSFWADELITTYAAIGIFEHGTPILPSGSIYTRSILNTSLIALSFKIFGVSEFSARIVSVVFGTLTILLVYLLGVKVANKRVGLLAAVLITFSVFEIVWSRQARMYAEFQFFYLLTVYLFYSGMKNKDIRILILSAIAFYFAYLDQRESLTFFPVAIVYLIFSKRDMLKKRYFKYGSLAVFVLALAYMAKSGIISLKNFVFAEAPLYAQKPFYFYATGETKNLFILLCIGIIISIILLKLGVLKCKSKDSYILLTFFIPFLIISIFYLKESRYALFIFPFLVICTSIVIDLYVVRNIINEDVCERISNTVKLKIGLVRNIKFSILFMIVIFLFIQIASSMNAFHIPKEEHGSVYGVLYFSNWKKGCDYVEPRYVEGDKIMTTLPLATMYYCGKADYFLRQFEYKGQGPVIDSYSGAITLNTYEYFMEIINNSKGWIIADNRIDTYFTDPRVRNYIRKNMTFHPDGSDNTIEVYSW